MLNLKDPSLLKQLCYLDGRWLAADSGAVIDVTNPASGEKLGTIPRMGTDETRRAIAARLVMDRGGPAGQPGRPACDHVSSPPHVVVQPGDAR